LGKIHLYYWKKNELSKDNFGDLLSKYIVEKISNKQVKLINPSSKWYRFVFKHYLAIGSILCRANENSIVWGSGIISRKEKVKKARFIAVRGPKTRDRLIELGYKVPEVYGDPGLLTSLFFKQKIKKKYKFGIIPHYVDLTEVKAAFKSKDVLIIDIMCFNIEEVLIKMLSCEKIITSSLHGLLVAHTFGINALWVKFSNKLAGDDIKFYDYFSSVGLTITESINSFPKNEKEINDLFELNKEITIPKPEIIKELNKGLINSCPFISNRRSKVLINLLNAKD